MGIFRCCALGLVVGLLLVPAVSATTFVRHYEASSAYVYGGGSSGGGFAGTVFCNRDTDTVADTGACVRYYQPGPGGWDHRGDTFTVTLKDAVFGTSTWYILGFDLNGDRFVDCNGGEPCYVGKGTITGTVPTTGDSLWIFPGTVKSSGFLCCPESFATRGQITIAFS